MKKRVLAMLAACVLLLAACGGGRGQAGAEVYAGFYALADFTRQIVGAGVGCMTPESSDPHDWEPTPREMAAFEGARVVIYGAGMGHFIEGLRAVCKDAVFIDATAGLPTDEDPHVWLNPMYAKQMMETIADGLSAVYPANEAAYKENYDAAAARLDALDADYTAAFGGAGDAPRAAVVGHGAFGHLCERYGLEQIALSGAEEDAEPTPARVAEVLDMIAGLPAKPAYVYDEPGENGAIREIAREAGLGVRVLDPFETRANPDDDYYAVMRRNLEALKR